MYAGSAGANIPGGVVGAVSFVVCWLALIVLLLERIFH
jgi:hypothetical protein